MTVTQHGAPSTPYGPGAGTLPGGPPTPPPSPPGYDWRYTAPGRRGNKLLTVGIVTTALIALAALTVGVIALVTKPAPAPQAAAPTSVTAPAGSKGDTTGADRALCTAIAPLMTEDDQKSNAWIATGSVGSPERDAALPKFRDDTEDWAGRIQDVVDANPNAHPFLLRTLQRFIDDRLLLVRNMRPGPAKQYDDEAWSDSMTAYGGPLSVCNALGIKW
ncbi:hypothetical protein MAHJHV58_40350 [Mycobacterium avium subsp. hominissuis]